MVQGYTQQDSGSKGGWTSSLDSRRAECGKSSTRTTIYRNEVFLCSYTCGVAHDQWTASLPEKSKLSRAEATDRETGGSMLSVSEFNQWLYLVKNDTEIVKVAECHKLPNTDDLFDIQLYFDRNRLIWKYAMKDQKTGKLIAISEEPALTLLLDGENSRFREILP